MTSPFESRGACYCVPSDEGATSQLPMMASLQQLAPDAEEVLDTTRSAKLELHEDGHDHGNRFPVEIGRLVLPPLYGFDGRAV